MHHEDGEGAEELEHIVPVADAVQAVGAGAVEAQGQGGLEAVDGVGGPGQGPAPQGADVETALAVGQALRVPPELFAVSQQVLGKGDGLCPLEVGVPGHDGVLMLFRLVQDGLLEL